MFSHRPLRSSQNNSTDTMIQSHTGGTALRKSREQNLDKMKNFYPKVGQPDPLWIVCESWQLQTTGTQSSSTHLAPHSWLPLPSMLYEFPSGFVWTVECLLTSLCHHNDNNYFVTNMKVNRQMFGLFAKKTNKCTGSLVLILFSLHCYHGNSRAFWLDKGQPDTEHLLFNLFKGYWLRFYRSAILLCAPRPTPPPLLLHLGDWFFIQRVKRHWEGKIQREIKVKGTFCTHELIRRFWRRSVKCSTSQAEFQKQRSNWSVLFVCLFFFLPENEIRKNPGWIRERAAEMKPGWLFHAVREKLDLWTCNWSDDGFLSG